MSQLIGNPALNFESASVTTKSATFDDSSSSLGESVVISQVDGVLQPTMYESRTMEEFTLFPKFPFELRRMIWTAICFIPRVIHVDEKRYIPIQYKDILGKASKYICDAKFPSVLHVSQEARKVGLEIYQLDFETSYTWKDKAKTQSEGDPRTYINWKCDTICLTRRCDRDYNSRLWQKLIANAPVPSLAVPGHLIANWMRSGRFKLVDENPLLITNDLIIYHPPIFYEQILDANLPFTIDLDPVDEDIGRDIARLFDPLALYFLKKYQDTAIASNPENHQLRTTTSWMRMHPMRLVNDIGNSWRYDKEAGEEGWCMRTVRRNPIRRARVKILNSVNLEPALRPSV